jgi:hypothetical protein
MRGMLPRRPSNGLIVSEKKSNGISPKSDLERHCLRIMLLLECTNMIKKKVFIDQPRFIGDIIFVMAIAQKYVNDGYIVDFPIDDWYLKHPSIQKNFPTINFVPISNYQNYNRFHNINLSEDDEFIYLSLEDSFSKNTNDQHMRYKYECLNFQMNMWRDVKIDRDYYAENELFSKLELKKDEKYNLINEYYGSRKRNKMMVDVNNEYRNIYMSKINGFNIFSWMGVIERAESVHTVHTSLQYLLDIMPNITTDLHIYPRYEILEPHSYYDYLFAKNYIYHNQGLRITYTIIKYLRRLKHRLLR